MSVQIAGVTFRDCDVDGVGGGDGAAGGGGGD